MPELGSGGGWADTGAGPSSLGAPTGKRLSGLLDGARMR